MYSADGKYEVSYKPNVVIHSDGSVLWIPPAIYKSSCTIDVKYFPFDEQRCLMKFGSWTFNGDQVIDFRLPFRVFICLFLVCYSYLFMALFFFIDALYRSLKVHRGRMKK